MNNEAKISQVRNFLRILFPRISKRLHEDTPTLLIYDAPRQIILRCEFSATYDMINEHLALLRDEGAQLSFLRGALSSLPTN